MAESVYIEEPRLARILFGSTRFAWLWLLARVWLGWEWFQAGWGKVFGGDITWRVWDWGQAQYSLTGSANIGWIRSGTVTAADGTQTVVHIGDSVAGFAAAAVKASSGPHPDVAYSWYVNFLSWIAHTGSPVVGPLVAFGEVVIGLLLIFGAFTGIAAFLGAVLNFSYVFAGSAGVNPGMILVSLFLMLAWRNAGWIGLDRWLLPRLGVPWVRHHGLQDHDAAGGAEPGAG